MPVVSPPADKLAEVAQGLLASAAVLGAPPEVVATTSSALFGYGFVVPQDVFDHWFAGLGEDRSEMTVEVPEPTVTEESEPTVTEESVPTAPVKRNGRGVRKPIVDGPEV